MRRLERALEPRLLEVLDAPPKSTRSTDSEAQGQSLGANDADDAVLTASRVVSMLEALSTMELKPSSSFCSLASQVIAREGEPRI